MLVERLVFAADPAGIADLVEMLEQEGIVDLAGARLVAAGIVGELDMRDARQIGLHGAGEIALHDLHVIDVVLHEEIVRADVVDERERLIGAGEEEAGNVARVDRLDQQLDASALRQFRRRRKRRLPTKRLAQRFGVGVLAARCRRGN